MTSGAAGRKLIRSLKSVKRKLFIWSSGAAKLKLIHFLKDYDTVSTSKAAKVMQMPRQKAVATLARLIRWEVIDWEISEGVFLLRLD